MPGPAAASQRISATLATPETASMLGVDVGSALIAMTRVVFDGDGRGIEYLEALYRPDRYSFETELVRSSEGDEMRWSPIEPKNTNRQSLPQRGG